MLCVSVNVRIKHHKITYNWAIFLPYKRKKQYRNIAILDYLDYFWENFVKK